MRDPFATLVAYLERSVSPTHAIAVTAAILDIMERMKVQRIGDLYLCSFYQDTYHWDIWISTYDPRTRTLSTGRRRAS